MVYGPKMIFHLALKVVCSLEVVTWSDGFHQPSPRRLEAPSALPYMLCLAAELVTSRRLGYIKPTIAERLTSLGAKETKELGSSAVWEAMPNYNKSFATGSVHGQWRVI